MSLGRKIALGAVFGLFAWQVPCLASEIVGCDMKRAQRPGAAQAATRKPAKPARPARVRAEPREEAYYWPAMPSPSRRIILQ